MENATKALIIAAAVLIAIVLIGLGISLLRPATDTIDQSGAVGNKISSSVNDAKNSALSAFNKLDVQF